MRRFFDTNVLVYSQDSSHRAKQQRAKDLVEAAIAEDAFVVSTQVLVEFYAACVRRRLLRPPDALAFVRLWSEHDTVPHTADLVLKGLELHQAHSLALWDGLIVQAALDARCDVLFSEDLQAGRKFGSLEIVNPFASASHEPPAHYKPKRVRARSRA